MERVSVNKGLLIGVLAVAAAALLALAYQLGRDSGYGEVPAPTTRIVRGAPRFKENAFVEPTPVAVSITGRADVRPDSAPAPSVASAATAPQAAAGPFSVPNESERGNAGSDPERASVAAYFVTVDTIQPGATSADAEGAGQEMAAALANGDTSGLDKMIRETEAARARMAAVTPPAPCAAYHRESLASLDDALEMLRSVKAAMQSSEPVAQLASVATRATALRTRAEALQKEELALRQRYGLKH